MADGSNKRQQKGQMTTSEIITIIVGFHLSHYCDIKNYPGHVSPFYKDAFLTLLHYTQFLAVMPKVITPMCAYFATRKKASLQALS